MKKQKDLEEILGHIDGKGYAAYREIKGEYECKGYNLCIDHVQVDPFAPPSKVRVKVAESMHQIPKNLWDSRAKKIATSDFLTRTFRDNIRKLYDGVGGSGKSGLLLIDDCGAQMIERTSVMISEKIIEVRFEVGLPAAGRKVLGRSATQIFCRVLPQIVEASLLYKNLNQKALKNQVELMLDQEVIREELKKRGLVTFIANGAVLPRENGISQRPLKKESIPFKSPESLEVTLELPYRGKVKGMGIPRGITLIVGGGYHGKSTLLNAIELGVYNHIAGDGRELVITNEDAIKVRAEDGRSIEKVNISAFINNLPNGKDTIHFSTQNASGSTSQAANMMEALEVGTSCLLIDEDTSATNFMIRDSRMQRLVKKEKEPITPFIDKVKRLYEEKEVSTILVVGGSGEYFDVADLVIMMDEYEPKDVTKEAKEIANSFEMKREVVEEEPFGTITVRTLDKSSMPALGRDTRIKIRNRECISYGKSDIHLDYVEQLIDGNQTNCIGAMLEYIVSEMLTKGTMTINEIIDKIYTKIEKEGLGAISSYTRHSGNLVLPRKHELCAAINRFRELKVRELKS
ncbi:MAG: ABC-ATPase domain-containing protein [Cellulosilyticum sp.]|nr:ABC-ATPase domain-containing protein [Cellulosilyticum sp.]